MDANERTTKSDNGLFKVVFDLSDDNGPVDTESVWAEPAGDYCFRLQNVPFFAYGYSEQDVVAVKEKDGVFIVAGVRQRGGHSTYRLYLPADTSEQIFTRDWEPLGALGCTYERANRRLVAVDVPPGSDIYAVYAALDAGEKNGRWEFEEGHCGHAVQR